MIRDSLREALLRMRDTPSLWITGLYLGALFALDLLLQAGGDMLLGARIGFLGLFALPFFLGGSYGAIRDGGTGIRGYVGAGARHFFGILLAWVVIAAAAFLTMILVMIPLAIAGGSLQDFLPLILPGVALPLAFFTFFADTAVVFEGRKVLDSIRRSVEFVMGGPGRAIGFYLACLAIGILTLLVSVVIWSFTIADRLQLFTGMNQTALQNTTTEQVMSLIGTPGLEIGGIIGLFAVIIGGTLLVSFKACFFRRAAVSAPAAPVIGEYDEKGRWYRY